MIRILALVGESRKGQNADLQTRHIREMRAKAVEFGSNVSYDSPSSPGKAIFL